MPKAIIIGKGPAGISASLYLKRGGVDALVIANGDGSLAKAEKIENYYGFPEAISGEELLSNGVKQAKRLGVSFLDDEVVGISYDGSFVVRTKSLEERADALIMATGSARKAPKVKNLTELEGRGVSYCAVCDAFFYRQKDVAVLGSGEYALNEAREISHVASSVVILTNGKEPETDFGDFRVITTPIKELMGAERLEGAELENGEKLSFVGLFVAVGTASSADLARKLGAFTENGKITVNEKMETNIPGLYAAGDCTLGMLQIAKAVYEGAEAGTNALKFIRSKSN